jgi:outer membrane lipoprotein SlyB
MEHDLNPDIGTDGATFGKKLHPLILIAAASVTVLSLAGTAHFLGWLPNSTPTPEAPPAAVAPETPPAEATSGNPAPVASETPAATGSKAGKSEAPRHAAASTHSSRKTSHASRPTPAAEATTAPADGSAGNADVVATPAVCRTCGTVQQVREVKVAGQGSVLGAVAGGVLGGLLGNQVGAGNGRKLATVAGAVGGAFAGHQVEKSVRSSTRYEVTVGFEDGTHQVFTMDSPPSWRPGDRVRVENGTLMAR